MLSAKLKDLLVKLKENCVAQQALHENKKKKNFKEEIDHLRDNEKNLMNEISSDFIKNYKGTKEEMEFMLSYDFPVVHMEDVFSFCKEKFNEMGFFVFDFDSGTMQRRVYIDLSNEEKLKKAVNNLPAVFDVLKDVENSVVPHTKKVLIETSVNWDLSEINGRKLYIIMNKGKYEIVIENQSEIRTLFKSSDPETLFFKKLIPHLNKHCQYAGEVEL